MNTSTHPSALSPEDLQRLLATSGRERFLMRDLRAKHATDFEASGGNATTQLGHSSRDITSRHYLRHPRIITPLC